jgi:hypothetical protein
LSAQAGATNLELDFWLQAIDVAGPSNNLSVQVSGDGIDFAYLPSDNPVRLPNIFHCSRRVDAAEPPPFRGRPRPILETRFGHIERSDLHLQRSYPRACDRPTHRIGEENAAEPKLLLRPKLLGIES